jgi:programmed cell death protein 5
MSEEDPELAALRKKRLAQLQDEQLAQAQEEEQRRQIENQKQHILKSLLTNEARERLARIKLAKPEFASMLENQLISLAQTQRLSGKINDTQFRKLLQQLTKTQRESKITFKRR